MGNPLKEIYAAGKALVSQTDSVGRDSLFEIRERGFSLGMASNENRPNIFTTH